MATWPTCNLSSLFHIYLRMESFSHLGRSLSPLQNTDYFLLTRLTFHSINKMLCLHSKGTRQRHPPHWILLHIPIHLFFNKVQASEVGAPFVCRRDGEG